MKTKLLTRLLSIIILVLFLYPADAKDTNIQQSNPLKDFKDDRTVTERTARGLKYMIRERRPSESWYDYFCNVLLSLGKERNRLDFGFQGFRKDKAKFEFIPFTVFDVNGVGFIVPVKTTSIKETMQTIHLRPRPGQEEVFDLTPVSFVQSKCENEDIYFLIYDKPKIDIYQINIDFPGAEAGYMAIVRNEDVVREHYKPVRSFTELARDVSADTRSDADKAIEKARKEECINATHKIIKIVVNPEKTGLKFTIELKPGTEDGMYNIKTEFLEGEEVYNIKSKLVKGQSEFQYCVPYEKIPKVIRQSVSARKRNFIEKFVARVRMSRELNESEKDINIYNTTLTSANTARFSIKE